MDLSVYIAELLNKNGTVSIPRIGTFSRVRMRGYYNAEEGKLYPPYHQTSYEFKPDTDESFLRYLVARANVSEGSAKYFLDKYLQNLILQAEIGEALLVGLGWISKDGDKLVFRPDNKLNAAVATFGFSPVDLNAQLAAAEKELNTPFGEPDPTDRSSTATLTDVTPSPVVPEQPTETSTQQQPVVEPVTDAAPEKAKITPPAEAATTIANQTSNPPVVKPATEQTPAAGTPQFHIEKELGTQPQAQAPVTSEQAAQVSPYMRRAAIAETPSMPPATPQPLAPTPVSEPTIPAQQRAPQEYVKPFYTKPWFIAMIAGAVIIAGIIAFYPRRGTSTGNKKAEGDAVTPSTDSVRVKPSVAPLPAAIPDTTKADSSAKTVATVANGLSGKTTALPASTEFAPEVETPSKAAKGKELINTNNYKFVLIGGSYGTWQQAREAAERYHAAGINASAFENTGRTIKVALGFFATWPEGQAYRKALIDQKKVLSWKLYMETIRKKSKK